MSNRCWLWIAATLLCGAALAGCASQGGDAGGRTPTAFNNADWTTVLRQTVTPDGYVRWEMIQGNTGGVRDALMRYVALIAAVSPDNRPEFFPSNNDRLAYWINAYNAMCMYAVIRNDYPATLLAGKPPGAIFSVDRYEFGGSKMTLNDVVRLKLAPAGDPRIYFALNFCAHSCPPLRVLPYDGAVLEAQLVDQGQEYLSDPRAAVRDGDTVKLNDLFTAAHQAEFLAAFQKTFGRPATGLVDALQPYVQSDSPLVGAATAGNLGFDWSLNRPPR